MFSIYKSHHNYLYNKLVEFSRNTFFYNKVTLKDSFETRINLIFMHFSILIIIFRKKNKDFSQEVFDNIFQNIEYHLREIGYGDVTVNKKMKILTRIFYDILLKINTSETDGFKTNKKILKTYFDPGTQNTSILIDNLSGYFNNFYNYCFELKTDNMLKGQINFKHNN